MGSLLKSTATVATVATVAVGLNGIPSVIWNQVSMSKHTLLHPERSNAQPPPAQLIKASANGLNDEEIAYSPKLAAPPQIVLSQGMHGPKYAVQA
ncbi:hypothetical protein S40288_11124 [Stachybotrys chartarum IBT 40288]|nr:hypothetical protein S40288_11124 [Stachybotrys chartarum IBT 40288]